MITADPTLSLRFLQEFDMHPARRPVEWRFCCPLPACSGKKMNKAHQSLSVNTMTGVFYCHRCHSRGTLLEFCEQRQRKGNTYVVTRVFRPAKPKVEETRPWKCELDLVPLENSAGARYLKYRDVPAGVAIAAGVKYQAEFYHRPAVVFPIRNGEGKLVGAQGRFINDRPGSIRMVSIGDIQSGAFFTFGALDHSEWTITEAPIDALSLAAAGLPSIALCGVALRPWLCRMAKGRAVQLAFDADKAGDDAAEEWGKALSAAGATPKRVYPAGYKDWNEAIAALGTEGLHAWLREAGAFGSPQS